MTVVWLPDRGWAADLEIPAGLTSDVWSSNMPLPGSSELVEFYVPEYLGPDEVIEVIARMPSLRVVQLLTAGYEHVLPHLREHMTLCNAAGVHDASTAELAVGLCIASLRGFPEFVKAQQSGRWMHARYQALADKRVLVVGFGSVGQAIAARLAPFEVEVTGVGRSAREGVMGLSDLPSALTHADVVVLSVPLTPQTTHLVDRDFLARLPDRALVVNVSRGAVIDTEALVAELETGRVSAALDVTDPEPLPPDHRLWRLPNVLISPHVGGNSSAFAPRAKRLLQAQLVRFAAGDVLANVVRQGIGGSPEAAS